MSKRPSIYRAYYSHWRSVVAAGLFATMGAVGESAALVAIASLAESLGDPESDLVVIELGPLSASSTTGAMLALAATLITFATIVRLVASFIGTRAAASWTAGRRRAIMRAYLGAAYTFVARQRAAYIHELSGQHCKVAGSIVSHLSNALNAALGLTVFMISALLLDAIATLVFFVLGTLSIVLMIPALRWTRRSAKRVAQMSIGLGEAVAETTDVVREIRTLGVRDQFQRRITTRINRLAKLTARLNFALTVTPQVFVGLGMLVLLGTFAVASQFSNAGFATLGGTALLLFRALTFGQQISGLQQRLNRATPYTEAIITFISEADESGIERTAGTVRVSTIDSIEFADTSFSYEDEATPAIKHTSFTLQRPGLIAVTGPSGTGKTTIAHLALGLLRATSGRVLVNGTPMADIRGGDVSGLVALVPQEPVILHATVMENIRFYREHISEDQAIEVAKSVGIHDTIMELEDGYDTLIGQTTRGLSGGQRQRIVIARAVVGKPSLIILDEPTSALDGESEKWVMQTLTEISKTSLALVIAHRQETIDRCKGILRFDDGRLVETVTNT